MKKLFFLVPVLLLCSCTQIRLSPVQIADQPVSLTVNLSVEGNTDTKSLFSPDEEIVNDVNLFIFGEDGELVCKRFESGNPRSVTLELKSSVQYNIRAIANWGSELDFSNETQLQDFELQWPEFQKNGYMLMSGSESTMPVGSMVRVYLNLIRACSKVSFKVNDTALGAVQIKYAKLCQVPSAMKPFLSLNKADSVSDLVDGDSASDSDLELLNKGEEMVFYLFENMQGTLLPDNNDPWKKVPDNLKDNNALLCSYVEVKAHFDGVSSIFAGDVTYRFYLGKDNCTNFDVKRNTNYKIELIMSTNLDAVSWKITSDVSLVEEGHGFGEIYAGRQKTFTELYMGDCFQYKLNADEALEAYFGGNFEGAKLKCYSTTGTESEALELGSLALVDGCWLADVRCINNSNPVEIWLWDPVRSRKVQKLNTGIIIKKPRPVFCNIVTQKPNPLSSANITINKSGTSCFVCLADEQGGRLGGKWFDNTLISISLSLRALSDTYSELCDNISAQLSKASKNSEYWGKLNYGLSYSGSPLLKGNKLAELCASGEQCFKIVLSLMDSKAEMPISVDYYPVSLNYDANSLKATLKNPSKLPFAVEYYDFTWFGSADESYDRITDDTSKDFTYTYSGETYKAYRLDCVNYENQAFGYTDKGSKLMQDGSYDLSATLLDYYTAYACFNRNNSSAAQPYSYTYTVFDIALKGRSTTYPVGPEHMSTSTQAVDKGAESYGKHGGAVIFSKNKYIAGTEGVNSLSDCESVARAGQAIVYAPKLLDSSLKSPAYFTSSQSYCNSGANAGSTQWLNVTLVGGCESEMELNFRQIAALRTLPNGYGDNFSTKYEYYWKGPLAYSSSLPNPGNNTLSYVYNPGTSNQETVNGTFGEGKFTKSNYSKDATLEGSYSAILTPGTDIRMIPVLDFINAKVYSLSETDSANSLGSSSTYRHCYHPGDCIVSGKVRTTAPDKLYKCILGQLFQDEMKYFNSNYEGFYEWIWRDVSAPFFPTRLEVCSAGSNCDKYTTWYYSNAEKNSLRAGCCIHIGK